MKTDFARQFFRLCYRYTFYLLFMELFIRSTGGPGVSWVVLVVMAGIFAGNYLLRNMVRRIWPMILYTAVVGAGVWFLPESVLQRGLLTGLAVGIMFTSFRYIGSGGLLPALPDIPLSVLILGLLATIFGLGYKIEGLVPIAALLTGVALLFYLLILYVDNTRNYMNSTKDVKGVPLRQILKMNSLIIAGIFLCMLVAVLLGEALQLPDALVRMGDAIVSVLRIAFFGTVLVFRWLGRLFRFTSSHEMHESAQRLRKEVEENHAFANMMEVFLKVLFVALVIFIIVRIFYRIMKVLSKKYHRSTGERVTETGGRKDVRIRLEHENLFERMRNYLSMEERARRIYKKRILELRKDQPPEAYETTADILEGLRSEDRSGLPELTKLYEGVRYGNVVPDRAYLSKMKKADRGG